MWMQEDDEEGSFYYLIGRGDQDDVYDFESLGIVNSEKLRSMREKVDWEVDAERRAFLPQLYSMISDWKGRLPDLRGIFKKEEIDWLLSEAVMDKNVDQNKIERFIWFVARTGYKDKPDLDAQGKPVLARTTALHHAARHKCYGLIIGDLFEIYHRFDANYRDESGYTHFHAACEYGCDYAVKKFLELGQDPNCLWRETGDSPLHLALKHQRGKWVAEPLLRRGANPNLANKQGATPLHMISRREYDDDLVKRFFEMVDNDDNKRRGKRVEVDARDELGRTPLQLAVANFLPGVLDVLLDRGADLAGFRFPAERDFDEWFESRGSRQIEKRLMLVSGALAVVERLEQRGYELDRQDALTVMRLFDKHRVFKRPANLPERWYDAEYFAQEAKKIMVVPSLSLYDLIVASRPPLTHKDYFDFTRQQDFAYLSARNFHACAAHLSETMARRFHRAWALDSFVELTRFRLPILCCEKIVERLGNRDLWHVCLAAAGQS
ncbi:hypothetical protein TKK_0006506 [Trichogramma kaykai]